MTNYEKIKAMSVEEMAEWLMYVCDAYYFPASMIEWLESEVEENG